MAIFRKINVSFWEDEKVVDDFTPEDRYFMLYLMTNPHTNQAGCYQITIRQMEFETGYNKDTIYKLLNRFIKILDIINYDENTKELLIKNWYKYNWTSSPKVIACIVKEAKNIKNKEFRYCINTLLIQYGYSMDTETQEEQEQEKEQEKEQEQNKEKNKQEISNEFDRFYANYPRKVGKAEAKKKFTNIIKKSKDNSIIANIFYGLECYKKSIIANKIETKYIKYPATWLNQECWKDYEKQVQFTKIDEDRLTTLQEIVLKSPILTDKERLEAEKEVAKLLEKKKQCQ